MMMMIIPASRLLIVFIVLLLRIEQMKAEFDGEAGAGGLRAGPFPMGLTRDSVAGAVASAMAGPTPGELAGAMPVRVALARQEPPPPPPPTVPLEMQPPQQMAPEMLAPAEIHFVQDQQQPAVMQRSQSDSSFIMRMLSGKEKRPLESGCDGIFDEARSHGYELLEYKLLTKDGYELKLHRLTRPTAPQTPENRPKKPYLLLHGLLGSSASFLRNIEPNYQAPLGADFDRWASVEQQMRAQEGQFVTTWSSTADQFDKSFAGDISRAKELMTTYQKLMSQIHKLPAKIFSTVDEVDFGADNLNFGEEFRQAYRKYKLPDETKRLLSNSLAYTLANFGYDVWLLNLRGSHFSRHYNGRYHANRDAEYWDFDVEKIVNEDLLASINFVKGNTGWNAPVGFISYSYSAMHVLNLLTKEPQYQEFLQPVVMMAPAVLTNEWHNLQLNVALKIITKALVPHNGPFPNLGRNKKEFLERMICSKLPITKKLCTTPEILFYGRAKGVKDFMFDDKQGQMISSDIKCGQTSGALVRRIVKGFDQSLHPDFKPFEKTRNKWRNDKNGIRRTVMLIHSEDDEIASISVAKNVRDSGLKLLVLNDVIIKEPGFTHTDFLFSKRNEYLVNAEIARYVSVFDFMMYQKFANKMLGRRANSIQ